MPACSRFAYCFTTGKCAGYRNTPWIIMQRSHGVHAKAWEGVNREGSKQHQFLTHVSRAYNFLLKSMHFYKTLTAASSLLLTLHGVILSLVVWLIEQMLKGPVHVEEEWRFRSEPGLHSTRRTTLVSICGSCPSLVFNQLWRIIL